MADIEKILSALSRSKFRSSFKLNAVDLSYINEKGFDKIKSHGRDFIIQRLSPAQPKNDGRQTPTKGHPVFKAQHATATCCRGCLYKWHKIPKGAELTEEQIDYVLAVITKWVDESMGQWVDDCVT